MREAQSLGFGISLAGESGESLVIFGFLSRRL